MSTIRVEQNVRRCRVCAITPKGAASDKARISPIGIVHLVGSNGLTFCGKRPSEMWLRPGTRVTLTGSE